MKKLLIASSAFFFLGLQGMQAQDCNGYEIKLNQQVKNKNYTAAYPILNEALTKCPSQKINFYNFGETVLLGLMDNANEADKKKYATELVNLIDKRIKYFPNEKKAFWEGEKISYQIEYGLIDKMEAYNKYQTLFNASEDTEKLSANTVLTFYTTALELLNEGKIDFEKALDVYFKTKKVAEDNIEMRSVEYGELAEKLDSLKDQNPQATLNAKEQQIMENAQNAKDIFINLNESIESILAEHATCEKIAPMFINKFKEHRDSLEWLTQSYQYLAAKDCYEEPIMKTIEEQYAYVWKQQHPQEEMAQSTTTSVVASSYGEGARMFKAGNYSGAIEKFKKALNEVSGSTKGDVAYYIALSYQKTGSLSNAVSWAKQAANYKPGYGAPYQLIAGVFGSNANSCGSNQFEKLSAYWVAADFANKACSVDSRACSWSRSAAKSYEATAPSKELSFQNGKKEGDRVSVSCFGGASTRVR